MFIWSKAPTRGLGTATHILPKVDNTKQWIVKASTAQFTTSSHLNTLHTRKASSSAKERQRTEREHLTRLLKESPGNRDARNFFKQFEPPQDSRAAPALAAKQHPVAVVQNDSGPVRSGVNLGILYQPTVFTRDPIPEEKYKEEEQEEPLHLALVKLRQPQTLDDHTLGDIALTLSQMAQLGMSTAVVLDCDEEAGTPTTVVDSAFANLVNEQAERFVAALEEHNEPGALLVQHALSHTDVANELPSTASVRGGVAVQNGYLLFPPIDDGVIPVIPPFAFDSNYKRVRVQADDVLLALIRDFAGITDQVNGNGIQELTSSMSGKHNTATKARILDRIIILDPLGGIPSENRADGAHVFVNLEAEYRDIRKDLQRLTLTAPGNDSFGNPLSLSSGNPLSKFVEQEVASLPQPELQRLDGSAPARHLKNLDVVERGLKLLPPSSSGLILTPLEAATKAIPDDEQKTPAKNPLLHNLLTDKPMISSSLPTSPAIRFVGSALPKPATFLKKGIPLTMIPDPRVTGAWQPPSSTNRSIELADDPRINFPKLVELINDSFRRKLDAKDYLKRIRGRVAGIIIAGDYEGGAICTWETPSSLLNATGPDGATPDSPYWVPYLDKFAVLTSSQGSGGVSDIVWAALTRTCFPNGVVWRSRTSNPVNKWYQERSKGMWNLPGDQWTMFWTMEGVHRRWDAEQWGKGMERDLTKWEAYIDVCSGIKPSWADGINRLD
ncbi:acetylglutamate synthase-like protein [Plenodomus tracheiphilus IPT5]|uniref:Amino-acid acetyltransferase, mitochondrial n=1 Tax=Plenodomus tracheiphilus IPT5 TaxID=1408161 RepID=A0A6A7ATA5_9PLEO|nr:acetylglutamate synthase-like protein [Plenodomus tracheiphilus IPT5]